MGKNGDVRKDAGSARIRLLSRGLQNTEFRMNNVRNPSGSGR